MKDRIWKYLLLLSLFFLYFFFSHSNWAYVSFESQSSIQASRYVYNGFSALSSYVGGWGWSYSDVFLSALNWYSTNDVWNISAHFNEALTSAWQKKAVNIWPYTRGYAWTQVTWSWTFAIWVSDNFDCLWFEYIFGTYNQIFYWDCWSGSSVVNSWNFTNLAWDWYRFFVSPTNDFSSSQIDFPYYWIIYNWSNIKYYQYYDWLVINLWIDTNLWSRFYSKWNWLGYTAITRENSAMTWYLYRFYGLNFNFKTVPDITYNYSWLSFSTNSIDIDNYGAWVDFNWLNKTYSANNTYAYLSRDWAKLKAKIYSCSSNCNLLSEGYLSYSWSLNVFPITNETQYWAVTSWAWNTYYKYTVEPFLSSTSTFTETYINWSSLCFKNSLRDTCFQTTSNSWAIEEIWLWSWDANFDWWGVFMTVLWPLEYQEYMENTFWFSFSSCSWYNVSANSWYSLSENTSWALYYYCKNFVDNRSNIYSWLNSPTLSWTVGSMTWYVPDVPRTWTIPAVIPPWSNIQITSLFACWYSWSTLNVSINRAFQVLWFNPAVKFLWLDLSLLEMLGNFGNFNFIQPVTCMHSAFIQWKSTVAFSWLDSRNFDIKWQNNWRISMPTPTADQRLIISIFFSFIFSLLPLYLFYKMFK